MKRVIAYIDGYNLYFGLRQKGWKKYYWLNLQKLAGQFIRPHQILVATRYFTTVVNKPEDKRRRQLTYLEALQTLSNFQIYYGQFLSEQVVCRQCGHTYTTHHEKMTDVNISVELMRDAFQDRFDVALLFSADSDLVAPVKTVQELFPNKKIISVFPPGRSSFALKQASTFVLHVGHNELAKCMFPIDIEKDGVTLRCPPEWKK
ncbi:MAG: NYN domain-containing protein [Anaerolineales bacterium]|nr:NYN domain-containing protein [Anaerolineales bacterium]